MVGEGRRASKTRPGCPTIPELELLRAGYCTQLERSGWAHEERNWLPREGGGLLKSAAL
jgi:hypothetical protein